MSFIDIKLPVNCVKKVIDGRVIGRNFVANLFKLNDMICFSPGEEFAIQFLKKSLRNYQTTMAFHPFCWLSISESS